MKLTTLNVVSPVASISLLIGSDVHHFVFTVHHSDKDRYVLYMPTLCAVPVCSSQYNYTCVNIFMVLFLSNIVCRQQMLVSKLS